MSTKLFVGGLPFSYSNSELEILFAEAGKVVKAEMVPDPAWGRTRGFGFVEMSTPEEAQAAIAKLNGFKIAEKNIYVTVAREKKAAAPPTPGAAPARKAYNKPSNWKAGRLNRGAPASSSGPANPSGRPAWPPRRDEPRPLGGPRRPHDGPPRRPSSGFGAPPRSSGFSRPAKYEPRGDGSKRSFSSPQNPKGDFGPSRGRGRPFGKPSRGSARPGPWKKFDKKSNKPAGE